MQLGCPIDRHAQRGKHEERVFTYFRQVKATSWKEPKHKATDSMNNTAWQNACDEAGLDIRLHDLRHTVGMRLREAGVAERTQDEILWHSKGTMTGHYAAAQVRELHDALELIKEPSGRESQNILALVRTRVPQKSPTQRKTA
jgi:integrase